jgi:hypothetical protein
MHALHTLGVAPVAKERTLHENGAVGSEPMRILRLAVVRLAQSVQKPHHHHRHLHGPHRAAPSRMQLVLNQPIASSKPVQRCTVDVRASDLRRGVHAVLEAIAETGASIDDARAVLAVRLLLGATTPRKSGARSGRNGRRGSSDTA